MTRDDLSLLLTQLGFGDIQVVHLGALRSIFGDDPQAMATAFARDHACELRMGSADEVTFERPLPASGAEWSAKHRAAAEASPDLPQENVIRADDQLRGLTRGLRGDAAKRPLETGGEGENVSPREDSRTDPDAG